MQIDPSSWLFGHGTQNQSNIRLLRPAEVAVMLGISRSLAYELIRSGQIPAIRVGSRLRVTQDDLAKFIEKCREDAGLRGDGEA